MRYYLKALLGYVQNNSSLLAFVFNLNIYRAKKKFK